MTKEPQRVPEGPAAPAGTSNADKARALIAMLENGGGAGAEGIPPARLRDWARDLVETVERAKVPAPVPKAEPLPKPRPELKSTPAPAPKPEPKPEPRLTATRPAVTRLFTKAPPVLVDRAPSPPVTTFPAPSASTAPAQVTTSPAATSPVAVPPAAPPATYSPAASYTEAARASAPRMTFGAPMPHTPPKPQAAVAGHAAVLSRQEVDRLVSATLDPNADPAGLGREHPAIVALTLLGKPTLQQAAVLRVLPGGQMRAVHRALRQLEVRRA